MPLKKNPKSVKSVHKWGQPKKSNQETKTKVFIPIENKLNIGMKLFAYKSNQANVYNVTPLMPLQLNRMELDA